MTRRRVLLWASFMAAAWLAIFADATPEASSASDVVAASPRPSRERGEDRTDFRARAPNAAPQLARLVPRAELLARPAGASEAPDLFPPRSQPPRAPATSPAAPVQSAPAPNAARPPFVFLGKKFEDGRWEAYLGQGESVFIAREGSPLDGGYRVTRIAPPTLTLTHEPSRRVEHLSIEGNPS